MNSFLDDNYFYPKEKPLETYPPVVHYDSTPVENAPGEEPEKGFTSIIIPAYFLNYPLFHYTGHCIGAVREHTDKEKTPYEIILVINGKTGIGFDNLELTMAHKVISLEKNVGYGSAMNRGIRAAKGEHIVLLSNDVLVFDHWLEDFHKCLEYKDLVMAHPMYGLPFARSVESMMLREKWMDKPTEESFSDFRDFSCVSMRKKLFDDVGLFDENFYLYKEDLDLFKRMDEKKMTYASTGLVNTFHIIGATTIYQSAEEQKQKEGEEYFNKKYA